jgi:2-haloacid dehalogenase
VFVFDAYGTRFDLGSLQPSVEARCPGYGKVVTQLWRLKQLEYCWLRTLMGEPFVDFWTVTRQSLLFGVSSAGFSLSHDKVEELASEYHRLRPFPEVREALRALPAKCAILSNGSQSMLDAAVAHAGLGDVLEGVISVDAARAFKPHPSCYALVESMLYVARQDVVFVSSNGFDVCGAKRFGFTTVWLRRALPEDAITPVDPSRLYVLSRSSCRLRSYPVCCVRLGSEIPTPRSFSSLGSKSRWPRRRLQICDRSYLARAPRPCESVTTDTSQRETGTWKSSQY